VLLVRTMLRASPIHGLGLFAAERIPKGSLVWKYSEGFDHQISVSYFNSLPSIAKAAITHYSEFNNGGFYISGDDSRFINHSETPNIKTITNPYESSAVSDIEIGEEILEDYREFGDPFEKGKAR
jgi:SET domain-containing protein